MIMGQVETLQVRTSCSRWLEWSDRHIKCVTKWRSVIPLLNLPWSAHHCPVPPSYPCAQPYHDVKSQSSKYQPLNSPHLLGFTNSREHDWPNYSWIINGRVGRMSTGTFEVLKILRWPAGEWGFSHSQCLIRPGQVDSQFIVRDIWKSHAGGRSYFITWSNGL